MKKIIIVLVIYNIKINESLSYEYFHSNICDEDRLYIFDNSIDTNCQSFNSSYNFNKNELYLSSGKNEGLSKAYNSVIQNLEKDSNNWIIISDQDTAYPPNYISIVKNIINNTNAYILCPVINDNVGIMSPCKCSWRGFSHNTEINMNKLDKYSFINSGMIINSTVFSNIKYDENLFLDFIDHDFVRMIRSKFNDKMFYVIQNIEIFQNFSGVTKNPFSTDFNRFKIYIKDLRYFYKKWYERQIIANIKLVFRAIKLSIRHKRIDFFKEVFA